ncbi:MAG: sialate O-acetylesterase [Opitutales bacterium]
MKTFLILFLFLPLWACAQLSVPNIFSDHMVLQRQQPIPVWGTGTPGTSVRVDFKQQSVSTEVDAEGNWRVDLEPEAPGFSPAVLTISAGESRRQFRDVLVGEVWLCSGQSNMGWSTARARDADMEIQMARLSGIRFHKVNTVTSASPRFSDDAVWEICSPETVGKFSAVGYQFGLHLQRVLGMPIGLVQASWGGTPAIAWTRAGVLDKHPLLVEKAREWEGYTGSYEDQILAWKEKVKDWMKEKNLSFGVQDIGIAEMADTWHQAALNDFAWEPVDLPAVFEKNIGDINGAVWFRRRIELPMAMRGKDLTLALGTISDYDKTWVNGVLIGETGLNVKNAHEVDRRYTIPARLTRGGELALAIRVFDQGDEGGFTGEARSMLVVGTASAVRLAGKGWVYQVEQELESAFDEELLREYPDAPPKPPNPESPHRPASLANGMLAPVAPYAIRGAIWYQGENDTKWEPDRYDERLRVMIDDWREWWENENLYFGVVQLANFMLPKVEPSDDNWPKLRESQRRLVRSLPNSGLVVTIDLGEMNDIHPLNKQDVGRRLARWALTDVYHKLELRGGPEVRSADFKGQEVWITFDQAGSGLHIMDAYALGGFTLAGADGVFYPAEARIEDPDQVIVHSTPVSKPVHVRYGWQNNPVDASLTNKERLPASPFEIRKD